MSKEYKYQCKYTKCLYENHDITSPDDNVTVGKNHYHKKCFEYKDAIEKIKELYYTKVSETVVMAVLVNTINNIVFKKHVEPKFLLFALQNAIDRKTPIRSPLYLHYLIDNSQIKSAYKKEQNKGFKYNVEGNANAEEQEFKFTPKKDKGFTKILGK